jgi:AcrR family transcriptional regulator
MATKKSVKSKRSLAEEPKRAGSEDRRAVILRAATSVFAQRGMLGVRMNEIAREAGVQPPHVHYYFPTLEDLQFEVILGTLDNLKSFAIERAALVKGGAWDRLEGYVRAFFAWIEERRPLFQLWMQFYALSSIDPKYRKIGTEIRRVGRDRIRMMIYEGVELGEFRLRSGWKADEAAITIQALITGDVIMAGSEEGDLPIARFAENCVRTIASVLGRPGEAPSS